MKVMTTITSVFAAAAIAVAAAATARLGAAQSSAPAAPSKPTTPGTPTAPASPRAPTTATTPVTPAMPSPPPTPATPTTPETPRSATAPATWPSLTPLAFLAGTWQGSANGGYVEEIWSAAVGNSIVGSFRWLKPDGSAAMFELLTITSEGDEVRLRLRHFSPTLAAKEPVDQPMTLLLAEHGPQRALFRSEKDAGSLDHIAYVVKDDVLHIDVAFAASDPPRPPLRFELQKRPPERVW